jgi:hypothetical protein
MFPRNIRSFMACMVLHVSLMIAFLAFIGCGYCLAQTPYKSSYPDSNPDQDKYRLKEYADEVSDENKKDAADFVDRAESPNKENDKWGLGGYPIIGYSPDTSLVLGGGAVIYFNPDTENPYQRLDEYGINASYSFDNQASISLDAKNYFSGNKYLLDGSVEFMNYPTDFYGTGPDTPDSAKETYTQAGTPVTLSVLYMIREGLYIGPEYDFFYSDITDVEPGSTLDSNEVLGSGITHSSGLGVMAVYDTTNRKLYKKDGYHITLKSRIYSPLIGSSTCFGSTEIDIRRYFTLRNNIILAMQLVMESAYGDVPFFYMPSLGGNSILRGYPGDRYIANNCIAAQTEVRFPIFWRFGGVVFIGAGEVEEKINDFGTSTRVAGGVGLRFALNKKQTINLRLDLTCNSEGEFEKYMKLREAF